MAELYPPYIDGTLPAFAGKTLTVPFTYNRATNPDSVKSVVCKIKTAQNDKILNNGNAISGTISGNVGIFNLSDELMEEFKRGQYYKIQMAFLDNTGDPGYYSTVGVTKFTTMPTVEIKGLKRNETNANLKTFIGIYTQQENGDITEKVYSYRFIIRDSSNNIIFDTGELAHYAANDVESYTSTDQVNFYRDLDTSEIYSIQYIVTTTNNLVVESPKYYLTEQLGLNSDIVSKVDLKLNYIQEEGAVEVNLKGKDNNSNVKIDGMFVVLRSEDYNIQNKTGEWVEVNKFSASQSSANRTIFIDYTVEQGKTYYYAIQEYNSYFIYSDKIISNPIQVDFDDIFLFDGKRQLKLKFNPQISSFKTQLSENRQETIGNKYPFFFRNAAIGYKTFPISGLISMYLDDNETFVKNSDIQKEEFDYHRHTSSNKNNNRVYKHTDLLEENFTSERLFKLEVLDWLNDGNVKLFRSPAEGNYLVRIMDVSMAPNTTLGRMLHTVSCTAYECAEFNCDNLLTYRIIEEVPAETIKDMLAQFGEKTYTISTLSFSESEPYYSENLLKLKYKEDYVDNVKITNLMPGSIIELVPQGGSIGSGTEIMIGRTGNYYAENIEPISGIYLKLTKAQYDKEVKAEGKDELSFINNNDSSFSVSYQYKTLNRLSKMNWIDGTSVEVGKTFNIVGENKSPILSSLKSSIREFTKLNMASFFKRPVGYLYYSVDEKNNIISPETVKNLNIFESFVPKRNINYTVYDGSEKIETNRTWADWYSAYEKRIEEGYKGYSEYRKLKTYKESKTGNFYKLDLFWLTPFLEKIPFTDENCKRHNPYALYILKDYQKEINEKGINKEEFDWNEQYLLGRFFEKEEMDPEKEILKLEEGDLVLDAWSGEIHSVGDNWTYNPTISFYSVGYDGSGNKIFTNENIVNLLKINKQDIYDIQESDMIDFNIGNGVYCFGFYQDTRTHYEFEENIYSDTYDGIWQDVNKKKAYNDLIEKQKDYLGNAEFDEMLAAAEAEYEYLVGDYTESIYRREEPEINGVPLHLLNQEGEKKKEEEGGN